MAPKRDAGAGDYRKLKNMLDDLRTIKQELLPEDGRQQTEEELKGFDDFQRLKHQLASKLQTIRQDVDRLNELRKAKGEERDTMTIRMHTDNTHAIKEAVTLFNELKELLKKDEAKTGKKRLDEKELSDRRKYLTLLGEEIKILTNDNSAVKVAVTSEDLAIQSRREKRRAKEREDREKRRGRRAGGKGGDDIQDEDFRAVGPQSEQEQQFEAKVQENMAEQDAILEDISRGLDDLKELAIAAGKQLTVQAAMIEQVENKMDETIGQFQTANKRLKQILDESGGVTRWCPMLLCAVLLLALVGYMFKIV